MEALSRGTELLNKHGLSEQGWTFALDRGKNRAGRCDYRTKRITVSKHLVLNTDRATVDIIILHEIAHALVGAHHKHDDVWKAKAIEIGSDGQQYVGRAFCEPRWKIECACGAFSYERHNFPRKMLMSTCTHCRKFLVFTDKTTGERISLGSREYE
jgi:predicted SprT family Zn-dependent metalloprotease